jgi:hypothetical protein
MTTDPPDLATLVEACAQEAGQLAGEADGALRRRLLVLAHTLALAGREARGADAGAGAGAGAGPPVGRGPSAADLRAGAHDDDLLAAARALRPEVAARLRIAHPGYDAR